MEEKLLFCFNSFGDRFHIVGLQEQSMKTAAA